ncbi:MAG TPA: segregation/condensation protein A [Spirochaetota bacterium]|nr:segregation/condensation protein A [Spirochaetota bacterium]
MDNGKDSYHIKIDQFEGTFDLLLFLVKDSKINLHDVPLSEITQGLINFWKTRTDLGLDVTSDYIYKTSILLYIKSKHLIPVELAVEEDEGDDRREFVDNLLEYQKYKNAAQVLKENLDSSKVLMRSDTQQIIDFKDKDNWEEISIIDLIVAFSRVAKEVDTSVFHTLDIESISIDDKIDEIMNFLIKNTELLFHTLFGQNVTRYELIITFLALLELVKMGKIYILQHKLFGNIKILKREKTKT